MPALPSLDKPLNSANLRDLNQSEYLLNQMVTYLDQAEQAGRDVEALRLRRDDLARQVSDLKRVYFGGPGGT